MTKIEKLLERYGKSIPVKSRYFFGLFERVDYWLWIELSRDGTYYTVFKASGKDYHSRSPIWGFKATSADFNLDGTRRRTPYHTGACRQIITLRQERNEEKAEGIYQHIEHLMDRALSYA